MSWRSFLVRPWIATCPDLGGAMTSVEKKKKVEVESKDKRTKRGQLQCVTCRSSCVDVSSTTSRAKRKKKLKNSILEQPNVKKH